MHRHLRLGISAGVASLMLLLGCTATDIRLGPPPSRSTPTQASPPRTTGITARTFAALWPEHSLDEARRTQANVDGGQRQLAWRLDPEATARRFAIRALVWRDPTVGRVQTWTLSSGTEMARVWLCTERACPNIGPVFDEEIILQRLVRPGPAGIWSVTEINSGRVQLYGYLFLRVSRIEVAAGRTVTVFTMEPDARGLPEGTVLEAGSVSWGSCGTVPQWGPATLRLGETTFEAATRGCGRDGTIERRVPGYVFAMRRSSGGDEHDYLSTMFDPGLTIAPAPLEDLTAVAVHFVPHA